MDSSSPESVRIERARFYFSRREYSKCLEQATDPSENLAANEGVVFTEVF